MSDSTKPEAMLMTLPRLAVELRKQRIIDKSKRTLERWVTAGIMPDDRTEPITLRCKRIGNVRHSSVRWVKDFLDAQA